MARDAKETRKANKRGAARLAAVQALYQMDVAGSGLNEILAEFESHWIGREVEGEQFLPAEAAFFRDIVSGVLREQRKLDPLVDEALQKSWPLKRIETILRAALRAGAYWAGLTPAAKQVYLTGFLAGAAAEQVRAAAEAAGRSGDSLAVSSRAIDELRAARQLHYRFAPPVYSAQVDDFYWWQNHTETPIVDAMIFFNREMLKQQGHGSP